MRDAGVLVVEGNVFSVYITSLKSAVTPDTKTKNCLDVIMLPIQTEWICFVSSFPSHSQVNWLGQFKLLLNCLRNKKVTDVAFWRHDDFFEKQISTILVIKRDVFIRMSFVVLNTSDYHYMILFHCFCGFPHSVLSRDYCCSTNTTKKIKRTKKENE